MPKQITINDTFTSNTVSFDSANSTYNSSVSGYPVENGIGDGSGTYAGFVLTTGSGATTNIYYNFNCSGIPEDATISSVACTARAALSTTSTRYIASGALQLCTGTTLKGSATTVSTSSATYFTLTPGSWTRNELQNAKIRFTARRGTSSTSSTSYNIRFFGAVLTVNYSYNGTAYTVVATSQLEGSTITPDSTDVVAGQDHTLTIATNQAIENIKVTDNDTDVTHLLEEIHPSTGGTISLAPSSYTTTGSISGTRYQSAIGHTVEDPSTQTGSDYCQSSGSTATIYYKFDFSSLPDDAIITDMTVQARGHLESTSSSSEVAELNTYYGTTVKGTQVSYSSTSNTTLTITPGTWTVAELKDDARVGFTIGYYGGLTVGITWTVTYTLPASDENTDFYEYKLTNVSNDHIILIEEPGVFIPPEEDPEYTYYPITISTINATTDPFMGTTRIQEGSNQVITISPSDPQLTLALDNGVDITSQLVSAVPENTYTVTTKVSGATYGFNLNSSTGYYTSTNNGTSKSASVARLNLEFESDCLVTIQYINYAEADYDYGMFGKLDTAVATDGLTAGSSGSSPSDSTSNYQLAKCSNSASAQTITYTVPAGNHFIDIKYGKDDASDAHNDSLQWKVLSIEATSAGGDYTYTLNNVNERHNLIFVFGNVNYYFITSNGTNCKLYPDGQFVKLEGETYTLRIVPNTSTATVSLTDNNSDQSSALQREDGVDKNNNPIVNYVYKLTNVQAAHNLVINCGNTSTNTIYIKLEGSWDSFSKVYKKINGAWVEQTDPTTVLNTTTNYVKG